jgi:3',5'-cyclic AMP phosphodiesterase CpdA
MFALLWIILLGAGLVCGLAESAEKDYQHVVILGDPHLPGKNLPAKEAVLQTINGWGDVDLVAVLGDICEHFGTAEEYAAAKQFFAKLEKPTAVVTGNHDYVFEDAKSSRGTYVG